MQIRELLTIVYVLLTVCAFSGGAVHGVTNYSAWKLIAAEDLPVVHQYVNGRIFLVSVPFFFLPLPGLQGVGSR